MKCVYYVRFTKYDVRFGNSRALRGGGGAGAGRDLQAVRGRGYKAAGGGSGAGAYVRFGL